MVINNQGLPAEDNLSDLLVHYYEIMLNSCRCHNTVSLQQSTKMFPPQSVNDELSKS